LPTAVRTIRLKTVKKILLLLFIALIFIILIGGSIFAIWRIYKHKPLPPPPSKGISEEEKKAERAEKQKALVENIKDLFAIESPGTAFSLGIYDLNNKEYFGYEDTSGQHAASVSKVLTAVVLLDKVDKGEIKLSDPMGAYNIGFQLEKMINISNQPSWDHIDAKLGIDQQTVFAKERLGLSGVDMRNNLMAVKDVTLLLAKLASGEILSETSRGRLFSYMQNTESEDFFSPAFKEAKVPFYHKTGKYLGEGHDVAIVKHKKNPFVLVIFSNNSTNPNLITRGEVMTKTAALVLEFFDKMQTAPSVKSQVS